MENQETGVEINKLCRLCLTQENTMSSIFNEDESSIIPLPLRIMACVSVEIQPTDCLPSHICGTCLCQVDGWLKFKDLCETADSVMKQFLQNEPITVERISQVQEMAKQWKQQYSCNKSDDENKRTPKCKTEPTITLIDGAVQGDHWNHDVMVKIEPDTEQASENDRKTETGTSKSQDKQFKCNTCGKTLSNKLYYKYHTARHLKQTKYKCKVCGKSCVSRSSYVQHLKVHIKHKLFECLHCGKKFARRCDLGSHSLLHSGPKTEEKRGHSTATKSEVDVHIKKQHKNAGGKKDVGETQEHDTAAQSELDVDSEKQLTNKMEPNTSNKLEEKRFKCKICGKILSNRHYYKYHLALHEGRTKYKCEICGRSCVFKSHLVEHLRVHTKERPFECSHCGKKFARKCDLRAHSLLHCGGKTEERHVPDVLGHKSAVDGYMKKQHTNTGEKKEHATATGSEVEEKPLECSRCKKKLPREGDLSILMLTHTGEKNHVCDVCVYATITNTELNKQTKHHQQHTKGRIFRCLQCGEKFSTKGDLGRHRRKHPREKKHVCGICGYATITITKLKEHTTVHTKEKAFECPECDKKFSCKTNLSIHFRTHTGEKKHVCEICGHATATRSNLNAHIKRHIGEKNHICHVCTKGFVSKDSLKKHLRSHSDERKYECDICNTKVKCLSSLASHVKSVHLKLKPFKCDTCNKEFSRRTNLREHYSVHENKLTKLK